MSKYGLAKRRGSDLAKRTELVVIDINDWELPTKEICELFLNINNEKLVIPSNNDILQEQQFLPWCRDINSFLQYIKQIESLNLEYLTAITNIIAYNNKDTNLSDEALQDYAKTILNKYYFRARITGKIKKEEDGTYTVETPYGIFTRRNWNKEIAWEGAKYGQVKVSSEWFKIGEKIKYNNEEYIIINAYYRNNGDLPYIVIIDNNTDEKTILAYTADKIYNDSNLELSS